MSELYVYEFSPSKGYGHVGPLLKSTQANRRMAARGMASDWIVLVVGTREQVRGFADANREMLRRALCREAREVAQ